MSNIRSFTGWTSANLKHSRKNIAHVYGYSTESLTTPDSTRTLANSYGTTINTINYSLPDTPVTITQTDHDAPSVTSYKNGYFIIGVDSLIFGERYDVSFKVTDITDPLNVGLSGFRLCDPAGNQYSVSSVVGNKVVFQNVPFIQNSNNLEMKTFDLRICGMSFTLSEFMVAKASAQKGIDITFESYSCETIPLSWSSHGEEYGGYYDPVNQKLVAEYQLITLKNKAWYRYTANQFCINTDKKLSSKNVWCDTFPISTTNGYPTEDKSMGFYSNGASYCHILFIRYNDSDDPNVFKAWLQSLDNDPCAIYELATPIEYDLTGESVSMKTYLDHNSFWSNTNSSVDVEYDVVDRFAARRMLMQPERRIVNWNQWCHPLTADYWAGYNDSFVSVDFNDGIATSTWLVDNKIGYNTSVRMNYEVAPTQTLNDIWYASYMLNPSKGGLQWGIEMNGGAQLTDTATKPAGEWSRLSFLTYIKREGRNTIYISNLKSDAAEIGMTTQVKAPIYINLTQMFGAGNEPSTVKEFERICRINNIDLETYHQYDTGSNIELIMPM